MKQEKIEKIIITLNKSESKRIYEDLQHLVKPTKYNISNEFKFLIRYLEEFK